MVERPTLMAPTPDTCSMRSSNTHETFQLSLPTPAGHLRAEISVPTGFIPVSDVVPLMRSLGEQALRLEEATVQRAGHAVSCRKGCAACCRMLVPVSPPEAFQLKKRVEQLPGPARDRLRERLSAMKHALNEAGLLGQLVQAAETRTQLTDEDAEPMNRAYYALRLPCPFLEDEACSIYDFRPAACRELLVTSPAEWCLDVARNPVRPVSVPFRVATILSLTWAKLTGGPARLIPLPVALDWADRHADENGPRETGTTFLKLGVEKILEFLRERSEDLARRVHRP